jgi:hypothetical protein
MTLSAALAAATTLIAAGFALSTLERWVDARRPHEAAWTSALVLFALASLAQWAGATIGWDGWSFRAFYLLGPTLSVPYLALGTTWLLAPRRVAARIATGVHVFAALATGVVLAAPFEAPIPSGGLPQGSDVFGPGPRVLAALGSALPSVVIVAGAVWSAVRARRHRGSSRLAVANVLIAGGTVMLGAAGLLNSVLDEMSAFALGHAIGLAVLFAGFLVTNPARRRGLRLVADAADEPAASMTAT